MVIMTCRCGAVTKTFSKLSRKDFPAKWVQPCCKLAKSEERIQALQKETMAKPEDVLPYTTLAVEEALNTEAPEVETEAAKEAPEAKAAQVPAALLKAQQKAEAKAEKKAAKKAAAKEAEKAAKAQASV